MIAILSVTFPGHVFKQVVQAFTSPDLPKRPESIKEIASIAYSDHDGHHAVFMLDVPDAQVAEFVTKQANRSAFISARAIGFTSSVHAGKTVVESIRDLMPLYP